MDADMTVEIPENFLHLRRKNMDWSPTLICSWHANAPCSSKQSTSPASLDENKSSFLVFKHLFVSNMKILPKVPAKLLPTELRGQACFFNLEVADDI